VLLSQDVFKDEKSEDVTAEQLAMELKSVAIEWKTLRNVRECNCSTPFDHFSRKVRISLVECIE
jgi:hypothetical protein